MSLANIDLWPDLRQRLADLLAKAEDISPDSRLYPGFLDKADEEIRSFIGRPRDVVTEVDRICNAARSRKIAADQDREDVARQRRAAMAADAPPALDPDSIALVMTCAETGKRYRLRLPKDMVETISAT